MTGLVGAVVEAWDELRIHRLRVLLALIGVAAAVCAITGITAATQMMTQAFQEQAERDMGREVTLSVNAWPAAMEGPMGGEGPPVPTTEQYRQAYDDVVTRYGIAYATRQTWTQLPIRMPSGSTMVETEAVDADYGVIHRIQPVQGRWFTDADATLFAPVLVVNEAFLDQLGVPDLSGRPTVVLAGPEPVRAAVVGVLGQRWPGEPPKTFLLYDHLDRWAASPAEMGPVVPTLSLWVPPDAVEPLTEVIRRDLTAALPGTQVDIFPSTDGSAGLLDGAARWVAIGIGAFTLLLGGLGLLNISLVTVRHRIREIGIRRSFGATSGRVFFGVLMESVVATAVAGVVGVIGAVAIIRNIPVDTLFGTTLQDVPPFPVSAALVGMASAVAVGAVAGLIPAVVAVRVKVIDAIRY